MTRFAPPAPRARAAPSAAAPSAHRTAPEPPPGFAVGRSPRSSRPTSAGGKMTWPYVKGRSDAEKDHTFNVQPVLDQSPRAHHGQRAAAGRRPMSGGVRAAPRAAQAPLRPMSASGLLTASPRVQRTAPSRPAWDAPAPSEAGSAIGDEMAVAVPPPRALSDPALRAIAEREECLQAITMQLQMVRRVRGQSGRLSGRILELFQWRIAKCIAALRLATLRVVEAAVTWRASDPDSSSSSSAPSC